MEADAFSTLLHILNNAAHCGNFILDQIFVKNSQAKNSYDFGNGEAVFSFLLEDVKFITKCTF